MLNTSLSVPLMESYAGGTVRPVFLSANQSKKPGFLWSCIKKGALLITALPCRLSVAEKKRIRGMIATLEGAWAKPASLVEELARRYARKRFLNEGDLFALARQVKKAERVLRVPFSVPARRRRRPESSAKDLRRFGAWNGPPRRLHLAQPLRARTAQGGCLWWRPSEPASDQPAPELGKHQRRVVGRHRRKVRARSRRLSHRRGLPPSCSAIFEGEVGRCSGHRAQRRGARPGSPERDKVFLFCIRHAILEGKGLQGRDFQGPPRSPAQGILRRDRRILRG